MGRLEGEEEGGAPNDEVRAIVYDYFGARGGDVHAAMAMGYRCVPSAFFSLSGQRQVLGQA
jgi:hypothetical protein